LIDVEVAQVDEVLFGVTFLVEDYEVAGRLRL
jgi:hypothetical protein